MIRTTEQIAMETVPRLIHQLTELTKEQPPTAEIEEAILASRALTTALNTWASSRHLGCANAHMAAQFAETHPSLAAAVKAYTVHPEVAAQMAALDPGPQALAAIAAEPIDDLLNELEDAEFDRIELAHPEVYCPVMVMQDALNLVRPPQQRGV
jgi:hypothetical protein